MAASDTSSFAAFAEATVRAAGERLLPMFGRVTGIEAKRHANDIVTDADRAAQAFIVGKIQRTFPAHGIVAEEEGLTVRPNAAFTWFIDPLDGTKNFATGVPLFGVMLGLRDRTQMLVGAIYLPVTHELTVAIRGTGVRLNGESVVGSQQLTWERSYGMIPIRPTLERNRSLLQEIGRLSNDTAWTNAIGSVAVSATWLAAGHRDWYVSQRGGAWDYAASSLILEEAGLAVTDPEGNPWQPESRGLVAAAPALHADLLAAVQQSNERPTRTSSILPS